MIVGPTGVGKTDLSLQICGKVFEIISADSVQVYKYLDIGSSKPTIEERTLTEHHLIDIVDPDYWFTAGEFCRRASGSCKTIFGKDKIPLFVGGTPFYIDSFFKGISSIPAIDRSVKQQLRMELKGRGLDSLYRELSECDSVFANKIHSNDKQRVVRGLEVYRSTGKPISSYLNQKKGFETRKTLYIGLYMERENLRRRIDNRVDRMIREGFIHEVKGLREMGYGPDLNSMKSIGYLELNNYFDSKLGLMEAVELIKLNTKKYAKRQMTWFKRDKRIHWFKSYEVEKIIELINSWLEEIKMIRL